ncbi:IclR family transcriptional regulator [Amylibacter ulvae]|uniref:IclR family transcriptional regulator n=1 Tax=Paramylibacter ulvae TaxID=1651968 RepID=A0ABQ3D8C3_9RHOB|nr:IclR family transcriptional regulator [Amylibacter ulvae]GHA61919.1 IclR family transcriptional regulator [Amylibacter ulvae]
MSVVAKAISLLEHFSVQNPELGLSQLCRLAKKDKATTYRYLTTLESIDFVEQNPVSKMYRIGPAVLHLADIREQTVPRREGAIKPLEILAQATGETAHVSILSGNGLHALEACESMLHSTRAVIDLQKLPLHATASGICALAFGPADLTQIANTTLTQFTKQTAQDVETLARYISRVQQSGFGFSDRAFENDIVGFAAPLFDHTGQMAGTVAVAAVASRLTNALVDQIHNSLITASTSISHNWGGRVPTSIQTLWAQSSKSLAEKEMSI